MPPRRSRFAVAASASAFILSAGAALVACSDTGTGSQILAPPRINEVNVTPEVWQSELLLEEIQYVAEVLDQNGNPIVAQVTWSSTVSAVASVDSVTGLALTRRNGITTIRADALLLTNQGDSITGSGTALLTVLAPTD